MSLRSLRVRAWRLWIYEQDEDEEVEREDGEIQMRRADMIVEA